MATSERCGACGALTAVFLIAGVESAKLADRGMHDVSIRAVRILP